MERSLPPPIGGRYLPRACRCSAQGSAIVTSTHSIFDALEAWHITPVWWAGRDDRSLRPAVQERSFALELGLRHTTIAADNFLYSLPLVMVLNNPYSVSRQVKKGILTPTVHEGEGKINTVIQKSPLDVRNVRRPQARQAQEAAWLDR